MKTKVLPLLSVALFSFTVLSCTGDFSTVSSNGTSSSQESLDTQAFNKVFLTESPQDFSTVGCNNVSYATIPEMGPWMIGRTDNADPMNSGCSFQISGSQSLTLTKMDWSSNQMTYHHRLFDTSTPVPVVNNGANYTISTAYDAAVVAYQGEYWVAFECHGSDGAGSPVVFTERAVAICVAPLKIDTPVTETTISNLTLDNSRLSIVIYDDPSIADPYDSRTDYQHSASVPKFVTDPSGNLYLYWSSVTVDSSNFNYIGYATSDARTHFQRGISYGTQLEKNGNRLFVKGTNKAVGSIDSNYVHLVYNGDSFQILSFNGKYLMTGATTSSDGANSLACASPLGAFPWNRRAMKDCYRIYFATSDTPLGLFTKIDAPNSPFNAQEYFKFVYKPTSIGSGETILLGGVMHGFMNNANTFTEVSFFNRLLSNGQDATVMMTPSGYSLRFQIDGNLVIYNSSSNPVWAHYDEFGSYDCHSDSSNCPNELRITFQGDGNLVLYNNVHPYFNSATAGQNISRIQLRDVEPYLLMKDNEGQIRFSSGFHDIPRTLYYKWSQQYFQPICDPISQPFPYYIKSDGNCLKVK